MLSRLIIVFFCLGALLAPPACFASEQGGLSKQGENRRESQRHHEQKRVDVTFSLPQQKPTKQLQAPIVSIAEKIINSTEIESSEDRTVRVSPWFGGRGSVGVAVDVTW
jgi:hypothetical protein